MTAIFSPENPCKHWVFGDLVVQGRPMRYSHIHRFVMDDMMVEPKGAGKSALTDVSVKNRRPGVHADAGPDRVRGLYLRVSASRTRYWFARLAGVQGVSQPLVEKRPARSR